MRQTNEVDTQPKRLLAGYAPLPELPEELNPDSPVGERAMRIALDRLGVPYVKLHRVRWYDRAKVRAALLATEVDKAPRGRGRPRKAA